MPDSLNKRSVAGGAKLQLTLNAGAQGPAGPAAGTVTISTAATGSTLYGAAYLDETIYLKSSSTSPVGSIGLVLPSAANSRVGQVVTFVSDKDIELLTVSASGGNIEGTLPWTTYAFEPYAFQCVSPNVWLRLA